MTILGLIAKPGVALMWCDTETFARDGVCPGETAKLAIAPLGPLAVCGTGRLALIKLAAKSAHAAASLDKLARRLPTELRIAAAKLAPEATRHDQAWCGGQVIVAGGYSRAAGRMLAWRFDGMAMFEPVLASSFLSPGDDELEADLSRVHGIKDLSHVARRQIGLLCRRLPNATGNALVIAGVTESSARCCRIPNFFEPPSEAEFVAAERDERPGPAPMPAEAEALL